MTRTLALILVFTTSILAIGQSLKSASDSVQRPALEFTKWSGDLNVPDPVSIGFDDRGRAYVTQTQRRKSQDLDIRANQEWIADDVGLQSVEDKRQFYHRALAPGDDNENALHVTDMNGDGHYDYRDLQVLSERVHAIDDLDGDGVADSIHLFAEDFRTEVTGIAAGVMHHDGEVYATIAPDVWKLRDADGDGVADERELLATGFGLHIAYAGHDMHGLTVGPDGKIYWSVGDKGISATSPAGQKYHYPNQGGVMRCNPDGSEFEVFAHGLRNVQELAFDQWGNLFGVDNDADKNGERERFVYIVKGMDAGWRCNYQYRGNDYDPWMAEGLWQPWHEGQPSYIVPPISHSIDGPAGFAFNPGTALNDAYKDYFFLTGAPNGVQIAFQVEAAGDSFRMVNEHQIGSGLPIVGINFGPDGGLYGVDWGGGYPLNQKGAVWKIDVPSGCRPSIRNEVKVLLANGFGELETERLLFLLGHADQRVRLGSQFALVEREMVEEFRQVMLDAGKPLLARVHAIWGLGQLARKGHNNAVQGLWSVVYSDDEPELTAQALRCLGDVPEVEGVGFSVVLRHSNPRVRFMAALGLGDHPTDATNQLVRFIGESTQMSDVYMRFALARALAGCATSEQLVGMKTNSGDILQLAAVVALRKQASPSLASYLVGTSDIVATEAALAIHDDFSVPTALPQLAAALLESSCQTEAFVRRAINANFRNGGKEDVGRLAVYAADDRQPMKYRVDALEALSEWMSPEPLDRVTGRARKFDAHREIDREQLSGHLSPMIAGGEIELRVAALDAASSLKITVTDAALARMVRQSSSLKVRLKALRMLVLQRSVLLPELATELIDAQESQLRVEALRIRAALDPESAVESIDLVVNGSQDQFERQSAVSLLAELENAAARQLANQFLQRVASGDSALSDVWLELAEGVGVQPSDDFMECLQGGDAKRGEEIFMNNISAQCVRCHRVGKTGSAVGPALDDVGLRRDRAHLLQSIVNPSADIDAKFQNRTVLLLSGKAVQGVLVKEDENSLQLLDVQGKTIHIDKNDVEESFEQETSLMPEMSKVLTRRQIRDLVAWLSQLKDASPKRQ